MAIRTQKLLDAVLVTGAGGARAPRRADRTFQASGFTSAGAGAVDVKIQASNDKTNWVEIGSISLVLGVAVVSDGFASDAPWAFIRGNVDSISGTDAQVTLWMGD
jgi:hypothetical protein